MNVPKEEYTNTFEKYLEYMDEEDMRAIDSQLKSTRKECKFCKQVIYDTSAMQIYKV